MQRTHKIFRALNGAWAIDRSIINYGTVSGTAYFTKISQNILRYKEEGMLKTVFGKIYNISREYEYRYHQGRIALFFVNDRPDKLLHSLTFYDDKTPIATGTHVCNKDTYFCKYTFINNNKFSSTYRVVGPSKDYLIRTTFTKHVI